MPRPPHIVFAGGVTPGHLHPGLAVADHILRRHPEAAVTFLGRGRTPEQFAVRSAGFGFAGLPSQSTPRSALHAVRFVAHNLAGYWAARWFHREQHVSLVVGLGGPASAAAVRAAMSRGIPTVMLEQNVLPGRVTRWLARSATQVCVGFAETARYFPSSVPVVVTGNPARPAFERLYHQSAEPLHHRVEHWPAENREPLRRLIVIGGARGAPSLNESMPGALARLSQSLAGWQVVHQTGEGQLQATARRYRDAGVDALVVAYIDEIASILFGSDLVVCRAAGTTLAELSLAGVPAVLVPYPLALDYQLRNAELFANAGAALMIDETELTGTLEAELAERLELLLPDDALRQSLARQMRGLARPEAAHHVTDVIFNVLGGAQARLAA